MMKKQIIRQIFYGCAMMGLISCATPQHDLSHELKNRDYLKNSKSVSYSGQVFNDGSAIEQGEKKTEIYPGNGEFIDVKAANKHVREVSLKGEITFNFEGESLPAVVNFILGEVLKENYVIAPGIGGNVTFATAKPINKSQVLPILELLLSWNNAALVNVEGRYHVLPKDQAIKGNLTPRTGSITGKKGYQVVAVPLTYVSPAEMEKVIAPYVKDGAIVKADNARNIIFLAGTNFELKNYLDTIEIFDVDWLAGMSTGIFYLQRVDAADIVGELETLFGEGAESPLAGMFRFVPLERLNGVLVITPQKKYLDKAQEWINRLDRADLEGGANLYVYSVKNIKADDLAGYLSDVFGGSRGSSSRKAQSGSVVSGQKGKEISSGGAKNRTANRPRTGTGGNDGVQITAIEESNQLLIKADVAEYEKIMSAIKRLDIVPLQVHVELKIIEVTLNNNMEHGMELFFGEAVGASTTTKGHNISTASSRSGSSGLSYRFLGTDAEAKLSMLEKQGRVALLSSPSVFVMNNKAATINVGDQIPVVSTTYGGTIGGNTGAVNNTFNSVRYIQTGVQVEITPRVNPGGLVYMEINQNVSAAGKQDANNSNRPISTREISSEIAVQSGQTVVMGGLISQNDTISKSGVPFFSRIPIVGGAFGKHIKTRDKTELMVLITPTVVENPEQARALTLEYAKKFEGLKPIKTNPLKIESTEEKETQNEN